MSQTRYSIEQVLVKVTDDQKWTTAVTEQSDPYSTQILELLLLR